jgi:hypothetical protein
MNLAKAGIFYHTLFDTSTAQEFHHKTQTSFQFSVFSWDIFTEN